MKSNFEEFLQEEFAKNYTGIKDQYEVAEEQWFEQLDVSELIEYGDKYADSRLEKLEKKVQGEIELERDRYINSLDETNSTYLDHKGYMRGLNYLFSVIKQYGKI